MKPLILISADDIDFYLLLDHVLKAESFETSLASDLDEIFSAVVELKPRVIVVDCRPNSFPAVEVCAQLKQRSDTRAIPLIALVSPSAERDHVGLIKAGVDDTFTRPVVPSKLIDCIRSALSDERPASGDLTPGKSKTLLTYADIEMCLVTYRVRRNGEGVHLGPTEFRLLRHLMENPGQVFTRDELISVAWQENVYVEPRTVDVHIGHLRRALNSSSAMDMIRTVRSAGYSLTDQIDESMSASL